MYLNPSPAPPNPALAQVVEPVVIKLHKANANTPPFTPTHLFKHVIYNTRE